ncbi:MAG: sigma-54 interaction domain-containing protein [Planctomycetota bacterium]|jgi:transcriptional regulator with PAS, ATPase and Fis domain
MAKSRGNGPAASNPLRNGAESSPSGFDYSELVDILPVGVFTLDARQRIESINRVGAAIVGLEADEIVGRSCEEVLRCSFCGPACSACQALVDDRTSRGFPAEIHPEQGESRSVLIDAVPLGHGRVAVLLRDVTDAADLRHPLKDRWVFHGLVCVSDAMKEVVEQIRDLAPYDSSILITGESGTGKEIVGRAIHAESPRASRPFVVVNCAAYSEALLESELFGHKRGSFAGADSDRRGRFELAEGGTLLLNEVAEIPSKLQAKLLRVLQDREIERMGESGSRKVDLRILAATHRDLTRDVRTGRFREDLFYRLNVFTLRLPPLRDRKEDIPALADHLLERLSARTGKEVHGSTEEVMRALLGHPWPGNVRELENVLESAVVRSQSDVLTSVDLPKDVGADSGVSIEDRMREALRRTAGCVTRAARLLGMHRTTLWRRMRESGIDREDFLEG